MHVCVLEVLCERKMPCCLRVLFKYHVHVHACSLPVSFNAGLPSLLLLALLPHALRPGRDGDTPWLKLDWHGKQVAHWHATVDKVITGRGCYRMRFCT